MSKRVLITGKNSYIGNQLADWLSKEPEKYIVARESVRGGNWMEIDFSNFDVVVHVAGIAHVKETKKNKDLYYKVNRDLALEVARKAKNDGVNHFVFLSTMSVYGLKTGVIKRTTSPKPKDAYGKSKLEAERLLTTLSDDSFTISIIRPPMIYGPKCKGNYPRLVKLALKTPVFPLVDNKRSMIYIDNLSEFIKQIISNHDGGFFFPQNAEYVNTSKMIEIVAETHKKKIKMTDFFNPLLKIINTNTINKVFGSLVYDMNISDYQTNYRKYSFKESIMNTESRL